MRCRLVPVVAMMLATVAALASSAAQAETNQWNFRALLDGDPIGTHSFTVTGAADRREMQAHADFTVKVLGITAYTYHHTATEQWQGDCLDTLAASTDDNGRKTVVGVDRERGATVITGPGARQSVDGCVMTFAYWNPRILKSAKLLDPQSGKYESMLVKDLGPDTIDVRGRRLEARHYRIEGPDKPIDLWYSPSGDWLGLDSMVGRRHLSYRLQ